MKIVYWSFSTLPSQTANSVSVMKMASAFASLGHDVVVIARKTDKCIESDDLFKNYDKFGEKLKEKLTLPSFGHQWLLFV